MAHPMRIRHLISSALLGAALFSSAYAQQGPTASALLGKWKATAQHPSGAAIVSLVQLSQSMQFTSSTTVNGNPYMEAAGSWKLSGNTLEWNYEQSSHPAIQKGFIDIDEIESVSAKEISLISKRSGRKHIYQRVE
jgi:hypothetical protein